MGSILDNGDDSYIWDIVSSDHKTAGGDAVNYYSVNKAESVIDPLYGEYVQRKIDGPYKVMAIARWPRRSPQGGEHGYTVEFDGMCAISRIELENQHAPYPSENDMLEMWRTVFHDADSMGVGLFFDVIKVDQKGFINDSPVFTDFVLTLKRRPQYAPERRIQAENPSLKDDDDIRNKIKHS